MNTFNRLAGEPHMEESASGAQLFDLCDYLRHSLIHTTAAEVDLAQEVELLASYLRLVAGFRGWELDAPVTLLPGTHGCRLQAHSICMVAQALIGAFTIDTPGQWHLPVRVGILPDGGIDIQMSLRALSTRPPVRQSRVNDEMRALCRAMSLHATQWSYSVVPTRGTGVGVQVRIRPSPASAVATGALATLA